MNFESELAKVAGQYRDEGYEVIIHPLGDSVPPFAAGYELDMIARKGQENVIVEVKQNRTKLVADPKFARLAEVTNSQPGWRLDLYVLESESPVERIRNGSREPTHEEIENLLGRAERVGATGDSEAAIVSAWAGLEATMRRVARDAGLDAKPLPNELLRTLYVNGPLAKEEFDTLRKAYDVRTRIVHGFLPTGVDPSIVHSVVELTRKLLNFAEKEKHPVAV